VVVAGVPPRLLTLLAVLGLAGVVVAFYLTSCSATPDRFAAPIRIARARMGEVHHKRRHARTPLARVLTASGSSTVCRRISVRAGTAHGLHIHRHRGAVGFVGSLRSSCCSPSWRFARFNRALAKDTMGRIICIGVFVSSPQLFRNIGMTMGSMP